MSRGDKILYGFALLGLLAATIFPFTSPSGFWLRTLTFVFMAAILAQGWNFIGGYTGYVSFGHIVFFGQGPLNSGIASSEIDANGNSPDDKFTVITVACLGACSIAPVIKLDGEFYGHLDVEVTVDVPGYHSQSLQGRDELLQAALAARSEVAVQSLGFPVAV